MKYSYLLLLSLLLCFGTHRYYSKPAPPPTHVLATTLKPIKTSVVAKTAESDNEAYDTLYARHLRETKFKYVLKSKDWVKSVRYNVAQQDRLILQYHQEIRKRQKILQRQRKELQTLKDNLNENS